MPRASNNAERSPEGLLDRDEPILRVEELSTAFAGDEGELLAVDRVSFTLKRGETLGIVGESGCGKTVTSKSIMRLIPSPPGRIADGKILFCGEDLVKAGEQRMQEIRGARIAMIFQEPMSALNPVLTIGYQIEEALKLHERNLDRSARHRRVLDMLTRVNMPAPEQRIKEYPHQLSGGMRQRAMIAMALACNPDILIADEPTTALDVTIQAQVLRLIQTLRDELGTAVILITHDLGVVAEVCDRVIVMYAARVVEEAPIDTIFHAPAHPYTRALLRSIPRRGRKVPGARLEVIPGMVPDLRSLDVGCRFQNRCERAGERCGLSEPDLVELGPGHAVRCFFPITDAARTTEV